MTHAEQKSMIRDLRDYAWKMSRYDYEEFQMFVKRDKDDEDLDTISQRRLQELYDTYIPKRRFRP